MHKSCMHQSKSCMQQSLLLLEGASMREKVEEKYKTISKNKIGERGNDLDISWMSRSGGLGLI